MRVIPKFENKKRGCQYCLHAETKRFCGQIRIFCPHGECPYYVLDKYETYEKFMASQDSLILVGEFFTTIPSCYELQKSSIAPRRIFSDGDQRVGF